MVNWNLVVVIVVLFYSGMSSTSHGIDKASDLLSAAADHIGEKEILTGEFRYRLNSKKILPSEEQIMNTIKEAQKQLRLALEKVPKNNKGTRQSLENSILNVEEGLRKGFELNRNQTIEYYSVVSGPDVGGDRFVEFTITDQETQLPRRPSVSLLKRNSGAGRGSSLYVDSGDSMAVAGLNNVSSGSQEPHLLGRLSGTLMFLTRNPEYSKGLPFDSVISNVKSRLLDSKGDNKLYEVTCTILKSNVPIMTIRCHIDSSRGYITPLVEERDVMNRVVREWKCENYFQPTGSPLWFPKLCDYREVQYESDSDVGKERTEHYVFGEDGVMLNIDIPEERFRLTINRGTTLIDSRQGGNVQYKSDFEIDLSLNDLDKIDAIEGLHLVESPKP